MRSIIESNKGVKVLKFSFGSIQSIPADTMTELYRQLCNLFIRPTRQNYSLYDLGSPVLESIGRRRDFELKNPRNLNLKCSLYEPSQPYSTCVVYLHSLNGSRLQSSHLAKRFLSMGMALANLDMSGSGQSEGEYVSLGYHQRLDAKTLMDFLHKQHQIKFFGLWGRSMGAVTALKTAQQLKGHEGYSVNCIALDSPYCNLMDLALDIADKRIGLPSLFVRAGMMLVKNSIEEKVRFRVDDLEMRNVARQLKIPVLILASKEDQLINWHHSQQIYNQYSSKDKELLFIKGSHASPREDEVISKIVSFMQKNLRVGEYRLRRNLSTVGDYKPARHIVSVKSSQNIFCESISPARKTQRSITPTYVISRQSVKETQRDRMVRLEALCRFRSQKTIYEQEQNQPARTPIDIEQQAHYNIISQKLLRMKPKNSNNRKQSQAKPSQQDSPRKGAKLTTTNAGLLKLKKKPNITTALLENNKLCHTPYLTNPNLVKSVDQLVD